MIPRRQRGFTLLEVMLAFVVLAVALGLLLGMLSRGLKQVTQSQAESRSSAVRAVAARCRRHARAAAGWHARR
jgi:prepilin-type N-terminal cleavage/methylation domain-containing protein